MRVTININDNVLAKITPRGTKILKDTGQGRYMDSKTPNAEGYTTWQLWELFQMFEGHYRTGNGAAFRNQYRIDEDEGRVERKCKSWVLSSRG